MMPRSHHKAGGIARLSKLARTFGAILLALPAGAHASTLNYPDFASTAGLSLVGTAYRSGNVLRLTNPSYSQRGGAWSTGKVPVASGFNTTFTFQLSNEVGPGGHGADGFTFNVQNDGNNITAGEGAGESNGPNDALSVGIDTFQGDPGTEPSDNYIKLVGNNQTLIATQDLYPLGIDVHDDQPHTVTVTYDGSALTVKVDDQTVFTNVPVDLGTAADANGLAFVGFGGRTGGYYQAEDITSWVFNSVSSIDSIGLGGAFTYADFSSLTDINLIGAAFQNGSAIALTPDSGGQTGGAWYDLREPVRNGFDTTFTFQIPTVGADGFAFGVTTDGFITGGESGPTAGDSIAVGFDAYQNSDAGDPSNSFAKLVGNGQQIVATQDLYPLGIDIHDGAVHTVNVHYDGANITVTVDNQTVFDSVALPLGSAALADGTALVGFVARTGGVSEEHDILSWNFTPAVSGSTVTGRIALESVSNLGGISAGTPLGTFHVSFRTPGTTTEVVGKDVTLTTTAGSAFGTFTATGVPAGTYDVAIKGSKNLRVVIPNVTVSGTATLPDVTLLAGDADNNNIVDIGDFGILVNAYTGDFTVAGSGYDPTADFNFDGKNDIGDFGLLVNNFGTPGAP